MNKFDVCVIGAGPSGYAAAMRALDFKKKVILIERNQVGGAGVHDGALSSKTWWELSRDYFTLRKHGKAFNFKVPEIPFQKVKAEVLKATSERKDLLEFHMTSMNNNGHDLLTFKRGEAKLLSKNNVEILGDNGAEVIEADNIILATGSRPRKLPNLPIDEKIVVTSDGIHNWTEWPESMVIVGAGVIGCEFATIFSNFGKTQVNLIDKGERILPFEDSDVVDVIENNLEEKHVLVHRNSKLIDMKVVNGEVEYELEYDNGEKKKFQVEKALVSVGRIPNYENLGLQEIGVEIDGRGIIDDLTQTSVSNIYAVGDITADIALVNVGELEGRYAIERIYGKPLHKLIYENISTIMFLAPEVAGVGFNEIQAKQKGINYKVTSLRYSNISRATAMRNTQGFIKLLVTNDDKMKILGMRVVGEHASSAIQAVALLISMDKGVEELAELIHPHPSIIEGIQECARMLLGKSMLKPTVLLESMACKTCVGGVYENIIY
jgi:dihydrolipoamide dehydrogenase